eukprot:GFYU01011718.1.p1 GENE.GFYU01011718.1~~GFYU01011718.1.p1  ORF type:complete len:254 (-),score=49.41 GFYU01011718.1:440-1201(-)
MSIPELMAKVALADGADDSSIEKMTQLSMSDQNLEQFFTNDDLSLRFLMKLVNTLNACDESVALKTRILILFSNLSQFTEKRDLLMEAFFNVNEGFEQVLTDKEIGHKDYGQALGRLHELTLVILIRVSTNRLETRHLMDFVNGNLKLGMDLIVSVLRVPSYEDEVKLNTCHLLLGFTRPDTYFAPGDDITPHGTADFTRRVDEISKFCVAKNVIEALTSSLKVVKRDIGTRLISIELEDPSTCTPVVSPCGF